MLPVLSSNRLHLFEFLPNLRIGGVWNERCSVHAHGCFPALGQAQPALEIQPGQVAVPQPEKKKLELKITRTQRSWSLRFSGAVRPGLSVVLGCGNWSPGVCRQEQKWKKKQGDGEKLNVLSQTSELRSALGRILVRAVLGVDFIQAGSRTSR